MPLELLRVIAEAQLPLEVPGQDNVDKIRVLAAAGMIDADLPPMPGPAVAVVRRVTGYGRASLAAPQHPGATKTEDVDGDES